MRTTITTTPRPMSQYDRATLMSEAQRIDGPSGYRSSVQPYLARTNFVQSFPDDAVVNARVSDGPRVRRPRAGA